MTNEGAGEREKNTKKCEHKRRRMCTIENKTGAT
jgi:hypothetical protein